MAELKTKPTKRSVDAFLKTLTSEQKQADAIALIDLMKAITKEGPTMWGPSIVGFGSYHYKYASGREGDWFLVGFSPRKQDFTIYIMSGVSAHTARLNKLGKYKIGKSCLYFKRLDDLHLPTLRTLVKESVAQLRRPAKTESK